MHIKENIWFLRNRFCLFSEKFLHFCFPINVKKIDEKNITKDSIDCKDPYDTAPINENVPWEIPFVLTYSSMWFTASFTLTKLFLGKFVRCDTFLSLPIQFHVYFKHKFIEIGAVLSYRRTSRLSPYWSIYGGVYLVLEPWYIKLRKWSGLYILFFPPITSNCFWLYLWKYFTQSNCKNIWSTTSGRYTSEFYLCVHYSWNGFHSKKLIVPFAFDLLIYQYVIQISFSEDKKI